MMDSHAFWRALDADLAEAQRTLRPVRVTIGSVSNGLATVQTGEMSAPTGEGYARIAGFALNPGDDAWALFLDPGYLILGPAQRTTPTGYTLDAVLNAPAGVVNGDAGRIWLQPITSDTSTVASTAATGTWQTALSGSITLPASGTFTVGVLVFLTMTRTPAGQAVLRGNINGVAGGTATVNPNVNTATPPAVQGWSTHSNWHEVSGLAGGSSVPLLCEFKGDTGSGVTTTAIEPRIFPYLKRTA